MLDGIFISNLDKIFIIFSEQHKVNRKEEKKKGLLEYENIKRAYTIIHDYIFKVESVFSIVFDALLSFHISMLHKWAHLCHAMSVDVA